MPFIKFIFLTLFLSSITCYSFAQAKIQFINPIINVDTLIEGELAPVYFIFKNIGDSNLIVNAVKSSCGCTVPEYDQRIVPPNTYDTILATYNTVGHLGVIDKIVRVESNASNGSQELMIKGQAIPYANNLRLYYSSSVGNVKYKVDKNKNITYTIFKSINKRPDDISLVVYQNDNNKGKLIMDKEELVRNGITMKIMKQSNMTVHYENIDPASIILSKDYTYILQFSISERINKSIHATINNKNIVINFNFID